MVVAAALGCAEPQSDHAADSAIVDSSSAFGAVHVEPGDSVAPPPGASAGAAATTIPDRFHGEWNGDRAACGTGSSETRLRIAADEIRFYESVGAVQAVDVVSDREVRVTAEFTGEGETWTDERQLTLAPDGGSLTVSGGGDLMRYRCP